MYSQLKSLSFMGISNSEMLLSDNDLKFDFLVRRPALEFQEEEERCEIAPLQEQEQEGERQELQIKEGEKRKLLVSSLKIKLPSLEEFKINQEQGNDQDLDDGFKTPTSVDKRIPNVLPCPPAPRKPKSMPSTKRKLMPAGRRVLLDLSNEIESLFPPSVRVDLCAKMKKVRQQNDTK